MTKAVLTLLSCLCVMMSVNFGQHHAQQKPGKPGRIEMPLMSVEIPDILLVDQSGKELRLYSDLVKDKIVLVHFFFTKCSDVCPMQGRALMKLKNRLGNKLGRDYFYRFDQ